MGQDASVLALGFFDGVHLGHQELFRTAAAIGKRLRCKTAVLTFNQHPRSVIRQKPFLLLNTVADRERLMKRYVDEVHFLPFDEAMMILPWRTFLEEICIDRFQARHIVCGADYRFGRHSEGDVRLLADRCAQLGVGCTVVPPLSSEGRVISSTYIRSLIAQGQVEQAAHLLGHPHILSGVVVNQRSGGSLTFGLAPCSGILGPPGGGYTGLVNGVPALVKMGKTTSEGCLGPVTVDVPHVGREFVGNGSYITLEFTSRIRL